MITFIDQLYSSISYRNKILRTLRYYSILSFVIRVSTNIIIPFYFILTQGRKTNSINNSAIVEGRVIVSLTSYPDRISRVWLVIETIFRQTIRPDKIVLWLSKDQFPTLEVLPFRLLNQRSRGLEIIIVDDNLGSHKKYYYALQSYANDLLLTIDDDIFYRSTMIEDLLKYSLRFPRAIICQYGLRMEWKKGNLQSYNLWRKIKNESSSNKDIFFGSGGGTLFPSLSLFPDVLNKDIFVNLAPKADDVWLNAMCRLNNTKIIKTDYSSNLLPVINLMNSTLSSENINLYKNDIQIRNVQNYYLNRLGKDPFKK